MDQIKDDFLSKMYPKCELLCVLGGGAFIVDHCKGGGVGGEVAHQPHAAN